MQSVKLPDIDCKKVILPHAPVFFLVSAHDTEIVIMHDCRSRSGFSFSHVIGAFLFKYIDRNTQPNLRVDSSSPIEGAFVITLLDYNFVAEEPSRLGGGVCNQRLFLG